MADLPPESSSSSTLGSRTTPREPIWPLVGVVVAAVLFAIAAARYPGGYDWGSQTISILFQPLAANGLDNGARPFAALAVLSFCTGIAVAFARIARRGRSRFHRKTIQIAGVGSMVCASLVVTPMHDLVAGVAVLLFVIAMFATFHMLWSEHRRGMVAAGLLCLSGTVFNAAMYYGEVMPGFLPLVQKVSIVAWVGWLFALYSSHSRAVPERHR